MKRVVRGAFGVLALSFVLTGCSRLETHLIEGEFYSDKPFVPAGTNTVLPPKLDRVDLFSHIARGDFCKHYQIVAGHEHPRVIAARTQQNLTQTPATGETTPPKSVEPPKRSASFGWILSAFMPVAEVKEKESQPEVPKVEKTETPRSAADLRGVAEACRDDVIKLAATSVDTNFSVSQRLARAYNEFASNADGGDEGLKRRRNEIQDEILRASEQRCNTYKLYLQTIQSNASFLSGSASTILGGLGAIFTDSGVSRALAGAAGISAGVGAQFQESYFMSLAVPAISEGIDNGRQTIFKQIRNQRTTDIYGYTLQHALLDAVRYDGACSIPRGLQEVADAARNIRTPGAFVMQRAIEQFAAARSSLNDLANAEAGITTSGGVIGSPIDQDVTTSLLALAKREPLKAIQSQVDTVNTQSQDTETRLSRFLAAAPAEDAAALGEIVSSARKEIVAARIRTTSRVGADTIRAAAGTIDAKLRAANDAYKDAVGSPDKRDLAFAELNVQYGEAQSKVLAEIEKAALPFFSAVIASRASSGATSKEQKIEFLCRVRALFVAVHKAEQEPEAPAACKKT